MKRPIPPYSTGEVCRLAGVSYRQLDYWVRTDLVVPSIRVAGGSGTQRRYSDADVDRLRVIKGVLDMGMSLQRIRRYKRDLRRLVLDIGDEAGRLLELTSAKAVAS